MRNVQVCSLVFALLHAGAASATTPRSKDPLIHGAVYGKIVDPAGKPVANATVVLLTRNSKVLAWARTSTDGSYVLAANPKVALDIVPSKNRGLLRMCCVAAAEVAMAPVRVVASMVANPGLTVASAGVSVASGTPAPLEAQVIASQVPNHQTVVDTQHAVQGAVAAQALGVGLQALPPDKSAEGVAALLVEAPGFKKAAIRSGAYWIEGPDDTSGVKVGLQAWVDTVKLSPVEAKGDAELVSEGLSLSDPKLTPSIAVAGQDIHVSVKLNGQPKTSRPIRVFARESPNNYVAELLPGKDPGTYEGTIHLERICALGPATICIGALRGQPVQLKLDLSNTDALLRFVKRLEDMQAGKPFGYDPMIMAAENRADAGLLIVSPDAETQSAPSATTPAPK